MKAEQKKLLRDALVASLVAADPRSLPLATCRWAANNAGFSIDEDEVERELSYLVKSGLAALVEVRVSKGMKRWEATGAGVDYAESENLV